MRIWVVHISHKHGDSYWTFGDKVAAKNRVIGWAEEWWERDGPGRPRPDADDDMIEEYYPFAEEQWSIGETILNQA